MVTAVGCSQLWSPPSSQASTPVQRGLPVPQQRVASPAPHLQSGGELSPLFKSILTPNPAVAEYGTSQVGPAESQAPLGGGGDSATTTEGRGSASQPPRTTTATPPPPTSDAGPSYPDATASSVPLPVSADATELTPKLVLDADAIKFGVGQDVTVRLLLTSAPTGVSGFILNVEIADSKVAEILSATFPSFGLATASTLPAASTKLQAVDLSQLVNPTSDEVLLATVKVRGIAPGTTDLRVVVTRVDDDDGQPVNPPAPPITLTVQ